MINAGDIHLADLNDEKRHRVLVVSVARFAAVSRRVLVAPHVPGDPDEVPFPWRVEVDGAVYAIDLLRSVSRDRLLKRVGRAPADAMVLVRRAVRNIT